MEMTNEKLSNLVQQQACDRSLAVHPLSMLLNGIIDPAVMGGFSNYEKVGPGLVPPYLVPSTTRYTLVDTGLVIPLLFANVYLQACLLVLLL